MFFFTIKIVFTKNGEISFLVLFFRKISFLIIFLDFLRCDIKVTYQILLFRGKTHSVNSLLSFVECFDHQLLLRGILITDELAVFRHRRICDSFIHQSSLGSSIFGPWHWLTVVLSFDIWQDHVDTCQVKAWVNVNSQLLHLMFTGLKMASFWTIFFWNLLNWPNFQIGVLGLKNDIWLNFLDLDWNFILWF